MGPRSYEPFWSVVAIDRHSLPVPVHLATHLVPERNLVPPLHDNGKECGQISYQYEGLVTVRGGEPE